MIHEHADDCAFKCCKLPRGYADATLRRYVMCEGDMPLDEWIRKEATGELPEDDYDVDAIVAERRQKKRRQFLVKWKACLVNR